MATRRSDIVDAENPGVYHCISRCVRRESLLADPSRRAWIVTRLEFLAEFAAIDVISFAVMDNHLHILLRIRPDIAHAWSDQEVARRRAALLPDQRLRRLLGAAPGTAATAEELASILNCPARIAKARRDVCNLGFFHRLLKEPCARRWNHEDGVTGHFWEGRFKSPRILNQRALLLVSAYIELNEVHACKAGSIQSSFWTSARRQWQRLCAAVRHACDSESCEGVDAATVLRGATWQPVFPCKVGAINCDMPPATSQLHEAAQPEMIPLVEYLEAVDSAGRRTRTDKAGFIGPTQPRPVAMAIAKALESLRFGAPLSVRAAERLAAARMEEWIDQRAQQRFEFETLGTLSFAIRGRGSCYGDGDSLLQEAARRGSRRVQAIALLSSA